MRIDTIMMRRQTMSFEVFPPKPELDPDMYGVTRTLSALRAASPDFVSVTYGAGGSNTMRAMDIAKLVLSLGMTPLSHLTAVGASREVTEKILLSLAVLGVENILALRGDIPAGADKDDDSFWHDFKRAAELVRFARDYDTGRDLCIGGAAYVEGHPNSTSLETDIEFMLEKERYGASFFITQLFFDDELFLRFAERSHAMGVRSRIIAGIMPVLASKQIRRIVEISGCSVPPSLDALLTKYADDDASMRAAGIEFASKQIDRLWREGFGIHVYTMNKSDSVIEIMKNVGFMA